MAAIARASSDSLRPNRFVCGHDGAAKIMLSAKLTSAAYRIRS
jgi:hypothetical protein